MKTLIIGLLAGGALLAGAGVANATPQEDAVVQQTRDAGYQYSNIPAVISNAHKVCDRLADGQPESQIVGDITQATQDPVEAQKFFEISRTNLCP